MILSHDTTVFTTDPRVEVLRFIVVDAASVGGVSVVLVIDGGFEDPRGGVPKLTNNIRYATGHLLLHSLIG